MATGTSSAICAEKDRLIQEWRQATKGLSTCIEKMIEARNARDEEAYNLASQDCEIAKLAVENARTMLEIHRAEHGC